MFFFFALLFLPWLRTINRFHLHVGVTFIEEFWLCLAWSYKAEVTGGVQPNWDTASQKIRKVHKGDSEDLSSVGNQHHRREPGCTSPFVPSFLPKDTETLRKGGKWFVVTLPPPVWQNVDTYIIQSICTQLHGTILLTWLDFRRLWKLQKQQTKLYWNTHKNWAKMKNRVFGSIEENQREIL